MPISSQHSQAQMRITAQLGFQLILFFQKIRNFVAMTDNSNPVTTVSN